jgi:indoleamine 2,3-dioxygenase
MIYNACVSLVNRFRQTHLGYAAAYIQKQHQDSAKNPTSLGTGGTPFMDYLKKHKDETESFLL